VVLLAVDSDSASPVLVAERQPESESVRHIFGPGACVFSEETKDVLAGVGAPVFGSDARPVSK